MKKKGEFEIRRDNIFLVEPEREPGSIDFYRLSKWAGNFSFLWKFDFERTWSLQAAILFFENVYGTHSSAVD